MAALSKFNSFLRVQVVVASTGGAGYAMAPTSPTLHRHLAVAKWNVDEFSSDPLVLVALLSAGATPHILMQRPHICQERLETATASAPWSLAEVYFPRCAACLSLKAKLSFTTQTRYVTLALLWFLTPHHFHGL